jgi:hypothetical protein
MPPDFTFVAKLCWLYPPYSRRHLTCFDIVPMQRFCLRSFVIALSPFRSRISFFIPITSTVHVILIYHRRQALLFATSSVFAVISSFSTFCCTTPTSHSLVIAIIFCSRNSSSIPVTSTRLHLAFTIVLRCLHHQDLVAYIYGIIAACYPRLAFITAVMHPCILSIICLLSPLSSSAVVISSYINVTSHNTIQIMSRLAGARPGEGSTVMDVVIATWRFK